MTAQEKVEEIKLQLLSNISSLLDENATGVNRTDEVQALSAAYATLCHSQAESR